MSLSKLTTKEIEERIDQFRQRSITLGEIIKDVSDVKAKTTLQVHMVNYNESLDLLRTELEKRNSK